MLNIIIVQGRLTTDPREYLDPSLSYKKAFFSIANTAFVKTKDGFSEVVTYIDCAFNKEFLAEKAMFLKKGAMVTLRGRLRNNNKPDIKRNIVVIDVESFEYPEPAHA